MMPGRWLLTLLALALFLRVAWLAGHPLCSRGRTTRLSEDIDYRVAGVPDTVRLLIHPASAPGETVTIRLLAIEPAAEPLSPLRNQSRTALAERVLHKTVTLQLDRRQVDQDGHLLAYVFCGDECLNEWLVQTGLCEVRAEPYDYPPMVRRLRHAEGEARRDRRGAWRPLEPQE